VWVESEDTAVVFGMPQAAIANGPVTQVLPLPALGPALAQAVQVSRASGSYPAFQPKK
jgi:two-component system chemotaxis response regulator CheB